LPMVLVERIRLKGSIIAARRGSEAEIVGLNCQITDLQHDKRDMKYEIGRSLRI
jgi:hypothetical protein